MAGMVSDVIWQKYDAIYHVVVSLSSEREEGAELVLGDLRK